jgi:hypothetical protein
MAGPNGSVDVSDTTDENRIYSGRLTYYKGAAVAHMLRYLIDDDSSYFQVLQYYQQQYAYKTAVTADLLNLAEQTTLLDLDTFFHQWIYKEGYPTYAAKWYQNGNQVLIKINQTTSFPASVSVFKLPIEIKLLSPQGDTVIRVDNNLPSQFYIINWSKTMSGMAIDPNNHIVNKALPIQNDPTLLDIETVKHDKVHIYPNPSAKAWQVKNIPVNSELVLNDSEGRVVYKLVATTDSVSIPSAPLVPGTYLLTIRKGKKVNTYKLVRP